MKEIFSFVDTWDHPLDVSYDEQEVCFYVGEEGPRYITMPREKAIEMAEAILRELKREATT